MINKILGDAINLLLYGGTFIGLCAACITAFSFELTGNLSDHLTYVLFVGTATAGLYCAHRVVGLKRVERVHNSNRFNIIRRFKAHIWWYTGMWGLISLWLFVRMQEPLMLVYLIPGGIVAAGYVLPVLPGGKRLRDLGWGKIVMIGWSWGWLTAFVPMIYFAESSWAMAVIHGLERMLFIILLTLPFEIRDISIDRQVGLINIASRFGQKRIMGIAWITAVVAVLLSIVVSFQYLNPSYALTMIIIVAITLPLIPVSYHIDDDYYFSGLLDGLMILAPVLFTVLHQIIP